MSIFKSIGKVLSAPARFIGHAAANSHIPLLSNAGAAVEKVGNAFAGKGSFFGDLGSAAQSAAPLAMFIPGVGPVLAAGIGAATSAGGNLLEHGKRAKLSDVAGQAGLAGLEAGGGKFALGKLSGAGSAVNDGIEGAVKSPSFLSRAINSPVAGKIGQFVTKHPLDAAQLALAGVGTVQGAQRAGAADELRSQAFAGLDPNATIDLSGQLPTPYRRKAPLRQIAGGY